MPVALPTSPIVAAAVASYNAVTAGCATATQVRAALARNAFAAAKSYARQAANLRAIGFGCANARFRAAEQLRIAQEHAGVRS